MKPRIDTMKHEKILLSIVIVVFLLIRIAALFASQQYVDGDRALTGIVAKHIMEKGIRPFYFYGEHYAGSQTIVAYIASLFFMLFGISSFSLHLTDIFLALIFVAVTYYVVRKIFNKRIALITSFLLAIPIPVFLISDVRYGSNSVALVFNTLFVYTFYQIFFNNQKTTKNFVFLGIIAGISYYIGEYILILLFVFLLFWYFQNKKFFLTRKFFIFLASFIIGLLPVIHYNLAHNFANLKQFLAGSVLHKIACAYGLLPKTVEFGGKAVESCSLFLDVTPSASFITTLAGTLPAVFGNTKLSVFYFLVFIASLAYLIYSNKGQFKKLLKSFIPLDRYSIEISRLPKEIFIIFNVLFFIIFWFLSGKNDVSHIHTIYPFLPIMIAVFIYRLYENKKINKAIPIIITAAILLISLFEAAKIIYARDEEYISDVAYYLEKNNIKYVYAPFFPKWKIIFGTNEEIIASCQDLCPCGYNYPPYEKMVADSNTTTYIFDRGAKLNSMFTESLKKQDIGYQAVEFKNQVVYQLEKPVKPNKIIAECKDSDGWPGEY